MNENDPTTCCCAEHRDNGDCPRCPFHAIGDLRHSKAKGGP